MDSFSGIMWVIAAALLFGSQFVPAKYCPKFKSSAYNVSMAIGIFVCSFFAYVILGQVKIQAYLLPYALLGGFLWVTGNYLLILGVAKAGMARAFCIINFSAVMSFFGGGVFLGELTGVTMTRIAVMLGAVGLVIVGSLLVTTTTPSKDKKGSARSDMMQGLVLSFFATTFFSLFNIVMGYVINEKGTPPGAAFLAFAPGIFLGALLFAAMPFEDGFTKWSAAKPKWHGLAFAQGILWSLAMVCIMFGWEGVGIAVGTPVQVGTQTIVSALWGILMFDEFRGLKNKSTAYGRFAAGAALTIAGIALMAVA